MIEEIQATAVECSAERSSDTPTQYDLNTIDGRNKLIDDWIADLHSGKYTQIRSHLHVKRKGMCCLGVLSNRIDSNWEDAVGMVTGDGGNQIMQNTFSGRECYGEFHRLFDNADATGYLYNMNDTLNKTFSQIADWVEQNWDRTDGRFPRYTAPPSTVTP
jgi:hypothetical protein